MKYVLRYTLSTGNGTKYDGRTDVWIIHERFCIPVAPLKNGVSDFTEDNLVSHTKPNQGPYSRS